MEPLDLAVMAVYMLGMLGVGAWAMRGVRSRKSFFVADRDLGTAHVACSVVATDVGGGFSIGLGGLGFTMGLSGSWLLFTGLVGAWLAAVFLVPRVKPLGDRFGWTSYAQYLEHRYDRRARSLAAGVSALGYAAFVGAQVLAGAKLAAAAFSVSVPLAVICMAAVILGYTVMGGLAAVVYTDTVQWIVLLVGVGACALPLAFLDIGGFAGLAARVPAPHLRFDQAGAEQLVTWALSIVPIWFVANTLYQRIYASRDVRSARRAFYLAGVLEWPAMALAGTMLGVIARARFPEVDPETGLPLLIRHTLPAGAAGLVFAAYFSAIMSTADSCLLAAAGHLMEDLSSEQIKADDVGALRRTRWYTVTVGCASVAVALGLPSVLEAALLAYAFMVSGLAVPTVAGLIWARPGSLAAFSSMIVGGSVAVGLEVSGWNGPLPTVAIALLASTAALLLGLVAESQRGSHGRTRDARRVGR